MDEPEGLLDDLYVGFYKSFEKRITEIEAMIGRRVCNGAGFRDLESLIGQWFHLMDLRLWFFNWWSKK
jgi:hypothetical protein